MRQWSYKQRWTVRCLDTQRRQERGYVLAETMVATVLISMVITTFFMMMSTSMQWESRLQEQMEVYQNGAFSRRSVLYAAWHGTKMPVIDNNGAAIQVRRGRDLYVVHRERALKVRLRDGQCQRISIGYIPSRGDVVATGALAQEPVFQWQDGLVRCRWRTVVYAASCRYDEESAMKKGVNCYETNMAVLPDTMYFQVAESASP